MRLLFITSNRVGDAVLSTGLLDHLIRRHPDLRITVACGTPSAPLFAAVPGLERIVILEKWRLSLHWLKLLATCGRRWWDLLLDLRNAPLTYALAARRRWQMGRRDDGVHRVVGLARVLGLESAPPSPRIWVTEAHRAAAARLVPNGSPVLAVGPTANWAGKIWRAERFAELAQRLTVADGILPGARIAVLGQADERPLAQAVIDAIPDARRIDLVGRVDLLSAYACLERTRFYVGNDSGLMHLAAAAGVPTLGLFGPSREELYGPWGRLCAAVRPPIAYDDIFPENYDHRTTGTLMDGLTVDRVEAAARALWLRVVDGV